VRLRQGRRALHGRGGEAPKLGGDIITRQLRLGDGHVLCLVGRDRADRRSGVVGRPAGFSMCRLWGSSRRALGNSR